VVEGGAPVVAGAVISKPDPRRAAVMALLNAKDEEDAALGLAAQRIQERKSIQAAEAATNTNPTEEQKKNDTYQKGEAEIDGIKVLIENPIGSTRSGVSREKVGRKMVETPWSVVMPATYGEIKSITIDGKQVKAGGADGDKLDIYIGPNTTSEKIWVIDQKDPKTGRFDEHKVMFGFSSKEAAMGTYVAAFSDNSGGLRIGAVTEMTRSEFKQWVSDGGTSVPLGEIKKFEALTADNVLDTVDWDRAPVTERIDRVGSRKGKEHLRVVKEAFFDTELRSLDAKTQVTKDNTTIETTLRDELISQADLSGGADSDTHRITFFEDSVTGTVVGLPTYLTRSKGDQVRVGLLPGKVKGDGMTLDDLMNIKFEGEPRYTMLSSLLSKNVVRATSPGSTIVLSDYKAYQNRIREPLLNRVASRKSEVQSSLDAATAASERHIFNEDGSIDSGGAGEIAADTVEDLQNQFRDIVVEALPRDPKGKVIKNLSKNEFANLMDDAFAQPENRAVQLFAAKEVLSDIKDSEWFNKLGEGRDAEAAVMRQQAAIANEILSRTYEAYRKGWFSENTPTSGQVHVQLLAQSSAVVPRASETVSQARAPISGSQADAARDSEAVLRRLSPVVADSRNRANPGAVVDAITTAINGLAAAGFNVSVFKQAIDSTVTWLRNEGGAFSNAGNLVAVVFGDVVNPGIEGIRTVLHEAAHALYSQESPSVRAAIARAVNALSDEQLGIQQSRDERIRQDNPTKLEDIAQERMAEHIAVSLDLTQGRTLAAKLWRFAKDLYLRAAGAVARSLYGPQSAMADKLALQWFSNNIERVSRNENRWSMVDFLGGARLTDGDYARVADKLGGESSIAWRWDPDSNSVRYRGVIPIDAGAMKFNLFRQLQGVNSERRASVDQDSAIKLPDVAAQNSIEDGLQSLWVAFNRSGGNRTSTGAPLFQGYSDFVTWVLPDRMEAPKKAILQHNAELRRNGLTPVPHDTRIADLSEYSQRDAANRAAGLWNKLAAGFSNRAKEADHELSGKRGTTKARFDANARRVMNLVTDYTNGDALLQRAKQSFEDSLGDFSKRLTEVKSESRRAGVLEQTITQLEGEMTDDIARQYQTAMNDLLKRISSEPRTQTRFYDLLRAVAELGIDFQTQTPDQIRQLVIGAAQYDPVLRPLVATNGRGGFTREANALLSIAISFARRDALAMHAISIQRAQTQQEKQITDHVLGLAVSDAKDAIKAARKQANTAGRIKARLALILDAIERMKAEQDQLKKSLDDAALFLDFYRNNVSAIDSHRSEIDRVLGAAGAMFEAVDGAKYPVPPGPSAPSGWSRVETNMVKFSYTRDAKGDIELRQNMDKMRAYLDAHPPGTALHGSNDYNTVLHALTQLEENAMHSRFVKAETSLTVRVLGSVTDMLKSIGMPETAAAVRKLLKLVDYQHRFNERAKVIGTRWGNAERRAMKACGIKDVDLFRSMVFDAGLKYIEGRKDIQFSRSTYQDAVNAVMPELRLFLMSDPKLAKAIAGGGWNAIQEFFTEHQRASFELVSIAEQFGIKINDDANGFFRKTKGAPLFESMRRVRGSALVMFDRMRPTWGDFDFNAFQEKLGTAPDEAITKLQALFTPEVWRDFVTPIANRTGTSAFYAPKTDNGLQDLASIENTKAALERSGGNIVAFVDELYNLSGGTTDKALFLVETVDTLLNFYKALNGYSQEASASRALTISPGQQLLMEARRSEEFPSEWLEFRSFDYNGMRDTIQHLAFHGALGRDASAVFGDFDAAYQSLKLKADEYDIMTSAARARSGGKSGKTFARELKIEADERGVDLKDRADAAKKIEVLNRARGFLEDYMRSKNASSAGLKPISNLIGSMVSATVQGVSTALTDTVTLFRPIMEYGLSGTSLSIVKESIKSFTAGNAGSLAQAFGKVIQWDSDHYRILKEIGHFDSDNEITLKEKMSSLLHSYDRTVEATALAQLKSDAARVANIAAGAVKVALSTGVSKAVDPIFPTFKPHAVFTQVGQTMNAGIISGLWKTYSDMVGRAVLYYRSNPSDMADPAFKLDAGHLKYTKKFGGILDDSRSFDELRARLEQNGMTLEALAKDFISRGSGPVLPHEAMKRIARMASNDISFEASVATRAGVLYSNQFLAASLPLVGWSVQQFASLGKSFKGADWQEDKKALRNGMASMAAILGVSLAYSLLRDLYDEEVLGKKANVMSLSDDAMAASMIDRFARVGTFGIGGDFANSLVNRDVNREFSIDSRVFAVNSLMQLLKAVNTASNQGAATYATVYRQIVGSMGGSGYLQYAQALNNALSLDNEEARVTSRINVGNWLRTTGRTIGMEVKTSKGQDFTATPVTPWITEMQLAALAGDYAGFNDAKRQAITKAKEAGHQDAADYVAKAFQSRHPLKTVFKTTPTANEYRKLLAAMPERGRKDVEQAVSLYNRFLERLGLSPYEGRQEDRSHGRDVDPFALRRMAVSSLGDW